MDKYIKRNYTAYFDDDCSSEDSNSKIHADVMYHEETAGAVATEFAQWIVNVFQSKNFWLYLAAIVALRAYLSSLRLFGYIPESFAGCTTPWERFKFLWSGTFGVVFDPSFYNVHIDLISQTLMPSLLFIVFCLLMNAIRKSK